MKNSGVGQIIARGGKRMTSGQNRDLSIFFFISSILFTGFLIYVLVYGTGISRIISVLLLCNLIYWQLKTALLFYRSSKEKD
jgi:hypothetical protein